MKAILFLLAVSLFGQTYNNENWSNQTHQVWWGFNGNPVLTSGITRYVDVTVANGGSSLSTTPDPVGVPFTNTIGNFCIGMDAASTSGNAGDVWTLMHKSGSTWVASSVSVTLPNPTVSPVCDNVDTVSPSGPNDMLAVRLVTAAGTAANRYTAFSFVSPPIPPQAAVLTQTSNILPSGASGTGIWSLGTGTVLTIAGGVGVPVYCDILNVACSFSNTMLTQVQAGKNGTISNLCVYNQHHSASNDPYTITLNLNGSDTALTVAVAAGAAIGNYCDNTHTVAVTQTDLLVITALNTAQNNGISLNFGTIYFRF